MLKKSKNIVILEVWETFLVGRFMFKGNFCILSCKYLKIFISNIDMNLSVKDLQIVPSICLEVTMVLPVQGRVWAHGHIVPRKVIK